MQISDNSQKHVRNLILVFIILNTFLLSGVRLLPFIDLPNHLAEATIFKFYEQGNLLSQYYQPTPWYFPNTFHTVFCSLFPSVEWGNRVFHVLYLILLQASVFLVIKQLKGNPWYGLLAILFTYNYNVTFGFVGFAISLPILILLFYAILRYIHAEKFYLNFLIALLLLLLFFMHAQNALLGLAIYGLMLLYHYRKSPKKIVIRGLLVPLPLVILIFSWWFTQGPQKEDGSTWPYLLEYYKTSYIPNFSLRFRIVVFDNFQLREGAMGLLIASFFFFSVVIPVLAAKPWRKLRGQWTSPNLIYAGIFLLITSTCYFFAPDKLPGQTPIFQRFCTIVMLSFIIAGSILLKDTKLPWLKYLVVVVVAFYTLLWGEYVYNFNRVNKDFNASFFEGIPPSKTLAGLIYDNAYRGRKVYIHFPNYFLVWKQGISASKIIDYRFGVVRRVESDKALPFYEELIGEQYSFQPQYKDIAYLLVRGIAPVSNDLNLQGFTLLKERRPWRIYRNRRFQNSVLNWRHNIYKDLYLCRRQSGKLMRINTLNR